MNKVAILRRNGLGDLLCAFPLVLYLRKNFPHTSLTLFVDRRNAPLIPYLPPVEEVVIFPSKGNKYWNLYRTARRFRNTFDLAISAKTSPMKLSNLFLFWLKAKERLAYVDKSWHRHLINHPLMYDPAKAKKMHQALKGLKMVAPNVEDVPEELYPRLHIPETIREKYLFAFDQTTILMNATITNPASRFCIDRLGALLNRMYRHVPFHVVIVGQKQDKSRAHAIASRLTMSTSVHFPRNFDEFMVLLEACDLYFVGDGGIAHLGAALGKKEVVLYGETNPIEWGPLSKEAETFYDPVHVNHLSDEEIYQALMRKI